MKMKVFSAVAFTCLLGMGVIGCNGGSSGGPTGDPTICFHYHRDDEQYEKWNLWLWERGGDGKAYAFNGTDDYGVKATYPLSTWADPINKDLGFIVRTDSWQKDPNESPDRYVQFSKFKPDANYIYHVYLRSDDLNIYEDANMKVAPEIKSADFFSMTHITAYTTVEAKEVALYEDGAPLEDIRVGIYPNRVEIYLENGLKADYQKDYMLFLVMVDGAELSSPVDKNRLYNDEYMQEYLYDGELGALYTKEKTTFKVWSPFSSKIVLNVYDTGTPKNLGGSDTPVLQMEMTKGEKGVFSAEVDGDLEGKYYTYAVTNSTYINREIVDPYAKSCGVNGLRGMVVDFSKTNPEGWDAVNYLPYDRKELTVYETHVADVTSSSSWTGTEANRKLFKGMYESGTTYTEGDVTVKTGFDHIKELGVNAVQIIPIFDQANDERNMTFNWGYNPLNYNALEGGYSSNPDDGYARIKEFKELVKAYNEAGIEIIMDVVYNHVNAAKRSNFDVLLPNYYYRYVGGQLSNGSGCGNETATEHFMMRKFIVDSVKFWLSEYKLGGFRFDLMGLHDLGTMEEVATEAKKINEHVAIYGEPWTGGTSTGTYTGATKAARGQFKGYGAFNDEMRDALIKGGMKGAEELGWISNEKTSVSNEDATYLANGIIGKADGVSDPDKVVNYVTCHDNYTLYDRMIATGKYKATDEEKIAKMNVLANSVVFTSQGTTFMLAGEEFLRTKGGDHNSYSSSYKVNELDYSLKIKHLDMFENYQRLIYFKQTTKALHLDKDQTSGIKVAFNLDSSMVSYKLTDPENNTEYYILHHNGLGEASSVDLTGYNLYWSTLHEKDKELSATTPIELYETVIVYKK